MKSLAELISPLKLLNWQYYLTVWGLVAALFIGWTYFWYDKGATACSKAVAEAQAKETVKIVEKRVPVVQQAERDVAQMEQDIRTIKEKLNADLTQGVATDCSISPERLRLLRELADKTKL